MQGVVKAFDPLTSEGVVVTDADRSEVVLAAGALEGSVFRMLRQGQRVLFDLDPDGRATNVRSGAEIDMGLPTAEV
jgi:CspA family cold shock protein